MRSELYLIKGIAAPAGGPPLSLLLTKGRAALYPIFKIMTRYQEVNIK